MYLSKAMEFNVWKCTTPIGFFEHFNLEAKVFYQMFELANFSFSFDWDFIFYLLKRKCDILNFYIQTSDFSYNTHNYYNQQLHFNIY